MKKHILERYRRDGNGKLIIDIAASKVSDLYDAIVKGMMAEGLVIAAWVSVWEGLAALLMSWKPLVHERPIYRRFVEADYSFTSQETL